MVNRWKSNFRPTSEYSFPFFGLLVFFNDTDNLVNVKLYNDSGYFYLTVEYSFYDTDNLGNIKLSNNGK